MSRIDALKLNADLLAMHDQPLRPHAADLNTLRDAMSIVSSYRHLIDVLHQIRSCAGNEAVHAIEACNSICELCDKELS